MRDWLVRGLGGAFVAWVFVMGWIVGSTEGATVTTMEVIRAGVVTSLAWLTFTAFVAFISRRSES